MVLGFRKCVKPRGSIQLQLGRDRSRTGSQSQGSWYPGTSDILEGRGTGRYLLSWWGHSREWSQAAPGFHPCCWHGASVPEGWGANRQPGLGGPGHGAAGTKGGGHVPQRQQGMAHSPHSQVPSQYFTQKNSCVTKLEKS